jgi:hypothetical protein
MIRELLGALMEIAGLLFFGWATYFLSNLLVEELSKVALS